ncbi:inner membrane protein, partial [mine drainage metagenome]
KSCTALRRLTDALAANLVKDDANGQVRRVAARFALIGAAGEMATAWGLTGWGSGEAEGAARTCFAAWLSARGTAGASEPAAMLAQVRSFLVAHGESRFTPWNADDHAPRTINRAGYWRQTENGPEYFIEREAFRNEVCKGHDPAAVARVLAEHSALVLDGAAGFTRKERMPDGRHARVYRITPKLWEDSP